MTNFIHKFWSVRDRVTVRWNRRPSPTDTGSLHRRSTPRLPPQGPSLEVPRILLVVAVPHPLLPRSHTTTRLTVQEVVVRTRTLVVFDSVDPDPDGIGVGTPF